MTAERSGGIRASADAPDREPIVRERRVAECRRQSRRQIGRRDEFQGGGIEFERFPQDVAVHDEEPAGKIAPEALRIRQRNDVPEAHAAGPAEGADPAFQAWDGVVELATNLVGQAWNFQPLAPEAYSVTNGRVVVPRDRPLGIYRLRTGGAGP